ncbi:hypothetical protein Tsubulata_042280 [Turnera subulata]|uniref:Syringolide-induced protein 14-1-1 n=1 Tax=Turnera subulata TaxID=218843 RepID=A0A9Q0FZ56_9ROSI|nr:hypothetical protein Tsubulata_042280 [Turnera subulata]
MERQTAPKKLLKLLPKAVSAVNFNTTPFSPGKEKRSETRFHAGKGFSGPVIHMIPDEVRRKPKNESYDQDQDQEPTSPKVSCIGQIKHKKKMNKAAAAKRVSHPPPSSHNQPVVAEASTPREVKKKQASKLKRLFSLGVKQTRRPLDDACGDDDEDNKQQEPLPDRAPCLSQMKRFASGRGHSLSGFDWTAQIAPVDSDHHRGYYSDEERGDRSYEEEGAEEEKEEEEVIIPFSAPITLGSGVALQPKKEINIWKRRTMNPPRPLQLDPRVRAN